MAKQDGVLRRPEPPQAPVRPVGAGPAQPRSLPPLVAQLDDISPSLAEVPVSDFVEIDGGSERGDVARVQFSHDFSPGRNNHGRAVLVIVGDVRGAGFFQAIELVKDKETKQSFDDEESETLLRGFLSGELYKRGLICRADDRGDPVIQLSPPLICGPEQFAEIESILRPILTEAGERMHLRGN